MLIVILLYPTWKLCIHFVYKNCTRFIQLMHIQKVYCISANFCMHFAYKIYTKVCWNVGCILYTKILYTFCIEKFVKMWDTFCIQILCIHFAYINSDVQKVYITTTMYTICIQNLHRMYMQVIVCRTDCLFQHILTHLLCTS